MLEEDGRTLPVVAEVAAVENPPVTVPVQLEAVEAAVLVAECRADEVQRAVLPPGHRDEILVGVKVTRQVGAARTLAAHLVQHLLTLGRATGLLLGGLVDDQPDLAQVDLTTLDVLVHTVCPTGELGPGVEVKDGADDGNGHAADLASLSSVGGDDFGLRGKGRRESDHLRLRIGLTNVESESVGRPLLAVHD